MYNVNKLSNFRYIFYYNRFGNNKKKLERSNKCIRIYLFQYRQYYEAIDLLYNILYANVFVSIFSIYIEFQQ